MAPLRLHVIACPVFQRELELLAINTKNKITFQHLEMGLHEGSGENLRTALQSAIDAVPADECDAVAIGYGLCNRGVIGLQARTVPVIIPGRTTASGCCWAAAGVIWPSWRRNPAPIFKVPAGWKILPPTMTSADRILLLARTPTSPANNSSKNTARKTPTFSSNNSRTLRSTMSAWRSLTRPCRRRKNGRPPR